MYKYEIIIYWSDEDHAYIAKVPDLLGCIAHGASYESALGNVKEAIQLWIDTAHEFGNPLAAKEEFPLRGTPVNFIDPTSPVVWSDRKADE